MKFYLVHTDEGQKLVGTQAEVKALKQPLRAEEVPTDKDGLMAYVNDLMTKPEPVAPVSAPPQIFATKVIDDEKLARQIKPTGRVLNREEVEDFILDARSSALKHIVMCVIEALDRSKKEALGEGAE